MAHNMTQYDKMVSGRKKSVWHQSETNTVFDDGLMDGQTAFDKGFGWEPMRVAARIGVDIDTSMIVPDTYFIVRDDMATDDPNRVLGVVGNRHRLAGVGNRDNCDFAHALTSIAGNARIDTAGSLDGGKRIYVSACLASEQQILDDTIQQWVLCTTAHDGTACQEVMIVPIRVVCNNTLTFAMGQATNRIKIRHTKSAADKMTMAAEALTMANEYFAIHGDMMRTLAQCKINRDQAEQFLIDTIIPQVDKETVTSRAASSRQNILDLFEYKMIGGNQAACNGTMYGLVNAFTEYIERTDGKSVRKVKKADGITVRSDDELRFDAVMFGSGAAQRQKLMTAAVDYAHDA